MTQLKAAISKALAYLEPPTSEIGITAARATLKSAQTQAAVEPAMPKLGCVNHDCDKCKAGEPVATMWREKNAKLYPGIVFDLTDTGKSLPLGVRHQLYTSPPDHTKAIEALRRANLDCVDHFNAIKADYDKAQEAMRLALDCLKESSVYVDADYFSWLKKRDVAIAALEKECK